MMTEQCIRLVAQEYGLTIDKRITSGDDKKHFATFELSGPKDNVLAANAKFQQLQGVRRVRIKSHPDNGKPYLEFHCILCELDSQPS